MNKHIRIEWKMAPDIKKRVSILVTDLNLTWIIPSKIYCFRSVNANTRAYARIWGFGRIWQLALKLPPAYVMEVISEKFDRLDEREKDKVLLHEITHIPKNFSGSLMPHVRRGKRKFESRVSELIYQYLNKK